MQIGNAASCTLIVMCVFFTSRGKKWASQIIFFSSAISKVNDLITEKLLSILIAGLIKYKNTMIRFAASILLPSINTN